VGHRAADHPALLAAGAQPLAITASRRIAAPEPDPKIDQRPPQLHTAGQALVGLYDRVFLLSQSTMPAFNALLLAPLLYWSRLVPRVLPVVGMIRAPLLLVGTAAVLFGVVGRTSLLPVVLGIPIALWEFSLGVYLAVRGSGRRPWIGCLPRGRGPFSAWEMPLDGAIRPTSDLRGVLSCTRPR